MKRFFAFIAICAFAAGVFAQEGTANFERTITVRGSATEKVLCDRAVLSMAVQTTNASAEMAVRENAQKVAAVLNALKKVGVQQKDISTSNYNVWQESVYDAETRKNVAGDYRVSNDMTVRVAVYANLGEIIDAAIASGVNQFSSIEFSATDVASAMQTARLAAVKNAFETARTLCEAAGVRLGRVLSIADSSSGGRPFAKARASNFAMGATEDATTAISAGVNEIVANVTIVFEIQ